MPDPKCDKGKVCAYALYTDLPNNPWCHLADDSCNVVDGKDQEVLYKKGLFIQHMLSNGNTLLPE